MGFLYESDRIQATAQTLPSPVVRRLLQFPLAGQRPYDLDPFFRARGLVRNSSRPRSRPSGGIIELFFLNGTGITVQEALFLEPVAND